MHVVQQSVLNFKGILLLLCVSAAGKMDVDEFGNEQRESEETVRQKLRRKAKIEKNGPESHQISPVLHQRELDYPSWNYKSMWLISRARMKRTISGFKEAELATLDTPDRVIQNEPLRCARVAACYHRHAFKRGVRNVLSFCTFLFVMADSRCWTKDFVIGLINLYKEEPCLWRVKSKDYNNRNLKNEAYDRLAAYCKSVFPEANRDFVFKKIQSLRGSFRKEAKKVLRSQHSGEVYVPTLWYYDMLLFTLDQEMPDTSVSNMDVGEAPSTYKQEAHADNEGDNDDDAGDDYYVDNVTEPNQPTGGNDKQFSPSQHEQVERPPEEHSKILPPASKLKRKIHMEASCTSDVMTRTKIDVEEFEATGINVAKKLQRMHPLQALYAESLISTVLKRGLLQTLGPHTDVCDNRCNVRMLQLSLSATSAQTQ